MIVCWDVAVADEKLARLLEVPGDERLRNANIVVTCEPWSITRTR